VAKREILEDAIPIGRAENLGLLQGSAPLRAFLLEQMAFTSTAEQDFAGGGNFKPFGHRFPGLNTFGTSHGAWLSWFRAHGMELTGNSRNLANC
jgi:hypothetical protein